EILNAIPVALVDTDPQGKFVFANRAAHQLLGRRDAELLGLRFHSATWGITYPDGRPIPPDLLPSARALRGQTVKGFQHILANPANRKKMLVSVTAMPIEDEMGRIIGSTAAIVETEGLTTPEAEAPEPVVEAPPARDLTRRVFEAAASALVVVGPDGRIVEANPQARALTGDSLDGADFADLFLPDADRLSGRQALRAAMTGADDIEPLASPQLGEGGVVWRALPLSDGHGRVEAVLLAGERAPEPEPDIEASAEVPAGSDAAVAARAEAERLAAELAETRARLAALERLSETERQAGRRLETVGRLTGGVAQDFASLLGVITSALDLMLKQADDPDRVRRLGQAALAAGQKGEVLTRRLSAFSQGDDAPAAQVMDATTLLRGLETRLRRVAGDGVDLLIETPSEPLMLRLDASGLEAALSALVRNAVEAGGEPPLSIAVRLAAGDHGGTFSVRDSGPGMSSNVRERALEPFFTTRPGAAGLGLSEAYAFARQSGGTLTLDDAPGGGTEVRITLPAA
ncbi:MAG: PAS domain-containing protein, partial [Brevundimonas sp.]